MRCRMEQFRHRWKNCEDFNENVLKAHTAETGGWRYDKAEYIENMLDTAEILDNYGIKFWPMFGSLLGMVRGDSPIAGDHDSDFAMHEDDEDKIIDIYLNPRQFERRGLVVGRASCDLITYVRWDKYRKYCSYIDLYFFRRTIPNWLTCSIYSIDEWRIEDMWSMRKHGRHWNIPAQPEGYLCDTYGPDWRVPKAKAWALK